MKNYNIKNEKIKAKYFTYMKEAKGRSQKTIHEVRKNIYRFDNYISFKEYNKKTFQKESLINFKNEIRNTKNQRTEKNISKSLLVHIIRNLKDFIEWLSREKGFQHINISNLEYLTLSVEEKNMASERKVTFPPTLNDVMKLIESIPETTLKNKRDKALISCLSLTGIRLNALMTLPLWSLDEEKKCVWQSIKRGVSTKDSKYIPTALFPIIQKAEEYLFQWKNFLTTHHGFKDNDPLFPTMLVEKNEKDLYITAEYRKKFIQSQTTIRSMLKETCLSAGIEYINPHLFRSFIFECYADTSLTPREIKCLSQNLGHSEIITTFCSYGQQSDLQQIKSIRNLKIKKD